MNIVKLLGGADQATTPDACHAVWAVVVNPNRRCSDVRDQIARVLQSAGETRSWLARHPIRLTAPYLRGYFEPVNTAITHPACGAMLQAVRSAGLAATAFSCMLTPSDTNFFAEGDQPVLICGPGNLLGNGAHGLDEHIEISA